MKYSKFALSFAFAALAAGCGKLPTTDNSAPATQPPPPAAATPTPQPAVVVTPPPAAPAPVAMIQSPASSDSASVQQFAQDRQSAQDLAGDTFAQKGDFIKAMTVARDDLNQALIQLSAKVDLASGAVQTGERSKLGTLQTQLNELDAKLDQVKISTESNWDQTKADAQQAYEQTRLSIQDMNQQLAQSTNI